MDNNSNPFSSKKHKPATYNSIKRSRAFRSQKKFTQIQQPMSAKQSLKTQLIALLDASPQNQELIKYCLDQLKEKLFEMKISQHKKQILPLQHQSIFKRKQTEEVKSKRRTKAKAENQLWPGSQSLNLVQNKRLRQSRQLLNLQQMRRKVKQSKQNSADKRLPTEKQNFRYQQLQEMMKIPSKRQTDKKGEKNYSNVKPRSMTQQVIRSCNNPARLYRHQSLRKQNSSPKKTETVQNQSTQNKSFDIMKSPADNDKVSKQLFIDKSKASSKLNIENLPVDNNEKIGDISTIMAQKETLNFLSQSCLAIKQELSPQKSRKNVLNQSKMLDFVDWKTNQLKNVFANIQQHKKRKQGLDKLSKIFPKGFFT